jgi:hypothetical protein
MVQYLRDDLVSGGLRWTDLTPAEWRERDERATVDLEATGTVLPYEKEFLRKDGSRVPVLIGAALCDAGGNDGVAFALDLNQQVHFGRDWHRQGTDRPRCSHTISAGRTCLRQCELCRSGAHADRLRTVRP